MPMSAGAPTAPAIGPARRLPAEVAGDRRGRADREEPRAWRTSSDDVATVQVIVAAIAPAAMTVSQAIGTTSGTAASSRNSATSRTPTVTSVIPKRRAFATRPRAAPIRDRDDQRDGYRGGCRATAAHRPGRRLRTSVLTPTSPSPRPASRAANTSAMSLMTATSSSRTFAARRSRPAIDPERGPAAIVAGGYRTRRGAHAVFRRCPCRLDQGWPDGGH